MSENYYFDKTKNSRVQSDGDVGQKGAPESRFPEDTDIASDTATEKKKKHIGLKILAAFLTVIIISVVAAAVIGFKTFNTVFADYKPSEYNDKNVSIDILHSESVTNILFIGQDTASAEENTRSDSMILVSLNTSDRTIKLTSFMRDIWVDIPGHGGAKLNAACQYGGPQLVCDTIETVFGIDIDGYCCVNFSVFENMIDAFGGITIPEVTPEESASMAKSHYKVAPGKNVEMNGEYALIYCRIRNGAGDDFGRTARQRKVIKLLIDKAKKTNPKRLMEIAQMALSEADVSLTKQQIISLGMSALPCLTNDIAEQQIPAPKTYEFRMMSGQDAIWAYLDQNKSILKEFIYGSNK